MTKHNKQPLTDEQMNELVIADANDPSAWGDPIVVGPSKGPRRIKQAKQTHEVQTEAEPVRS